MTIPRSLTPYIKTCWKGHVSDFYSDTGLWFSPHHCIITSVSGDVVCKAKDTYDSLTYDVVSLFSILFS